VEGILGVEETFDVGVHLLEGECPGQGEELGNEVLVSQDFSGIGVHAGELGFGVGGERGDGGGVVAQMVARLLKVPEVAVMTGLPESTLRFMRATGYGPRSARVGRRVMYRESDVASWIEEQFAADAERHHGFA